MPRIIAIALQKGGSSKTTTTLNLGAALVEQGYRVLLIDLDPQANLTTALGLDPLAAAPTIYDILSDTSTPLAIEYGVHIIPASLNLSLAEIQLAGALNRERILSKRLRALPDGYDFVLLDCPPTLGLLTINALSPCACSMPTPGSRASTWMPSASPSWSRTSACGASCSPWWCARWPATAIRWWPANAATGRPRCWRWRSCRSSSKRN
jgi:hypothetical protein